ncbi:Glycoside hydrolase, partial [Metarhizium majus ARSEF 297]
MLWGQKTVPQFQKNINYDSLRENKYKYILGFNEPDHPSQANMPIEEAVDAHIVYLDKYANVTLLSSPAVTSDEGGGPQDRGLDWLRKFLDLCDRRGCKVDFCAVHWYGNTTQADNLFSFLRDAHSTCPGKPIWLTEFSATGSSAEVSSFLRKVLPVLDGLDFIQRYAWFMATTGLVYGHNRQFVGITRYPERIWESIRNTINVAVLLYVAEAHMRRQAVRNTVALLGDKV